jgi:ribose transport system permease protein
MRGEPEKGFSVGSLFRRSDTTVVLATAILFIVFAVFSDGFLTSYNLFNISRTAALYMFIALSQAMVLIVGNMNLSLGQIGGLTVVVAGYCMQNLGMHPAVAVLIALLAGVFMGFVNGLIITKLKISSFVATLATSFVFAGLINGISEGYPYTDIPSDFTVVGRNGAGPVPILLLLAVATLAAMWYMFRYTVPGRKLLATGGNAEAARLSAVNTDRMVVIANICSGLFAAMAGILWVSRMGSAQPSTGSDWMVYSFAVAVIGGTALAGGVISPFGMFFSAYLIVMVKNGLVMLQANVYFEQTYLGVILLVAVSLESIRALLEKRRMKKELKKGDSGKNPPGEAER